MAEQTVDAAAKVLGAPVGKSRTRHLKLIGAPANTGRGTHNADVAALADLAGVRSADHFGLEPEAMSALVRRHGTEAPQVLELASGEPGGLRPLVDGLPYLSVEAIWAARHEMSVTVDDVLSRRTRSVLRRAQGSADAAGPVATMLAGELGRDPDDMQAEAGRFAHAVIADLERAGLRDADQRKPDVEQAAL
jgi:glycerol-3-phosphate dehydrogenase